MRGIKTSLISILAISLVRGASVGVAAQDEATAEPVEFTAKWAFGESVRADISEFADGVVMTRGGAWRRGVITQATDPRLQGSLTIAANSNQWKLYEQLRMLAESANYSLENDGGGWAGTATSLVGERTGETDTVVLHGEDAYEGLTAYVVIVRASRTFNAAILPGGMPPFPPAE